jgi:diguanylate cyclase (GGDEF)-like protein/PAS domain S-box-containing protein
MDKETILIVEDEKIIALDILRRLERFGYEVVGTAVDAEQALAIAEEQRPDLVLMDVVLSGTDKDGIHVAADLRRRLGLAIVFITAYADTETLARAREAEPFGYVLKPFKDRELFTTIDMALYKSGMERKLKRQERLFSAILHSINDAIVATDNDLRVLFMNRVAEDLLGWNEGEAQGKAVSQIAGISDPETGRGLFASPLAGIAEAPLFFRDAALVNRYGNEIAVDGSLSRIREAGSSIEGFILAVRDVTEIRDLARKVDYQASHDILTGLYNREELSLRLQELLKAIRSDDEEHSLVVLDVDRFRAINDTCGSLAGDELLRQIAECVRDLTSRNDTLARMGGDEFAVVLRNCAARDAVQVAKRVQAALSERRFVWNGVAYPISVSVGVVPLTRGSADIRGALAAGDDAVSMAREEGGNRVSVFQPTDARYERRRDEKEWIGRINRAAEEDRFVLYRQPIVPVRPGEGLAEKQEILVRMRMEDGRIALPGEFIAAAERYNLIGLLDRWVVEHSLREIRALTDLGDPIAECVFSINLSGQSLLEAGLDEEITDLCSAWGVAPSRLCFEVTETAAIQNLSHATRFIRSLKEKGFTFSLDDFGSGFSSFGYLQSLPVDFLKIDGSFVQNIDSNPISLTMVESINSMGHVLGLKTIAEYVVDQKVLERLGRIGVDYAQGFAISKPVPLTASP